MLLQRQPNKHNEFMTENFIPLFLVCSVGTQLLSRDMFCFPTLHGYCKKALFLFIINLPGMHGYNMPDCPDGGIY